MLASMIKNHAHATRLRLLNSVSLRRYDRPSKVYNVSVTRVSAQVSLCSNLDQQRWYSNASPEEMACAPLTGRKIHVFPLSTILTSLYTAGVTMSLLQRDFDAELFQETVKKSAILVSAGLAYEQYDYLKDMIEEDCLNELKKSISPLPTAQKRCLEIDVENIKFAQPIGARSVKISKDVVKIYVLMLFITKADDSMCVHRHNYEFCCTYTNKVPGPWIITDINHDSIVAKPII